MRIPTGYAPRLLRCFVLAVLALPCLVTVCGARHHWEKVADGKGISLWLDEATGLCEIRDARGNTAWSSSPPAYEGLNDFWSVAYDSAFILRYLAGNETRALFTGQRNCRKVFHPIRNGVRCEYLFDEPRLSFIAEYTLIARDRLRIRIPIRHLADPQGCLLDLRVLPFFGYLKPAENGYVILPDGCGGSIKPTHLKSLAYKGLRVYGERPQWIPMRGERRLILPDYTKPQSAFLNLPVFGVVRNGRGVLAVIQGGRYQAEIGPEITPNDFLLAVSPRLLLRELAVDMFGGLHAGPLFDRGDRVLDYYFLSGGDATYAGIAGKCRQVLLPKPGLAAGGSRSDGFRIRFFFGVERLYKDTSQLLRFTSFRQAEEILADLHGQGLRDLEVVLVGWCRRGYLGDNPRFFPADGKFGGDAGLKRLIATAKRLGYKIGLEFDLSYTFRRSGGFRRGETVRDIQGLPVDVRPGQGEYLLCPVVAERKFIRENLSKLKRLGMNGCLLLDGINDGLSSCYDNGHLCGAPDAAAAWRRLLAAVEYQVGVVGLSDLAYPAAAFAFELHSTCSELCDEAVPLTPFVFHGAVGYSFDPINLRRSGKRGFLKMVEYGGVPDAFLTASTVELMAEARRNPMFSGAYADWRKAIIAEYRVYARSLRRLQSEAIVDHRRLAKDVYLTAYAGGAVTVVNYSARPFRYLDREIGPETFTVIEAGLDT